MYLPNSLYERAPHYWILIGALLIVLGVYLGIEMSRDFLFAGGILGLSSVAWGIRVLVRRSRRPGEANITTSTVPVEQE